MPPSEARACAHAVLRRVCEQDAYADLALRSCARGLSPRDRALARRISYGAVQRKGTLDHLIERLGERRLTALDLPVRAALRAGLYELLFSDGSPDHAIVKDTVQLTRRSGSRGHGLVNALLRRAVRERAALLAELSEDSTPERAALAHSHPLWLAQMWWSEFGAARARALMAANNEPAELSMRVNTLVGKPAEVAARLADFAPVQGGSLVGYELPEALVAGVRFDIAGTQAFRDGAIVPQSRAAMLVSHVLDPQPGERVLDICAAPGGKSTHIAALMNGRGEIIAVEQNPKRAHQMQAVLARTHARNITVRVADATLPQPAAEKFDAVLVDAPCSGLGTLQAHPDLRWRASPQRIGALAELQRMILAAAAEAVRDGGRLVYSTCTISRTENEQQIERFLDFRPDFALDPSDGSAARPADSEDAGAVCGSGLGPVRETVPGRRGPAGSDSPGEGFITTMPDRDRTAGFFIARMRRR